MKALSQNRIAGFGKENRDPLVTVATLNTKAAHHVLGRLSIVEG